MRKTIFFAIAGLLLATAFAADSGKSTTVKGYVLDSACAYTKSLAKPVSADCAKKCAAGGSPLVILTKDGTVYLPIDGATPSKGQNDKLLPYAGQRVTATGTLYDRGGSKAMVIEKIAPQHVPQHDAAK
jgi:hypothetical protein